MRILIAGGDGYIGWPLALKLAWQHPKCQIRVVDNFTRRRLTESFGGHSLIPIQSIENRLQAYEEASGRANISFEEVDVASSAIDCTIKKFQPDILFHMAQIPSASYSMHDADTSIATVINNEAANLRVLWAVRQHTPSCHIVKLGSFGEYCKDQIDVAEGYFQTAYKGKQASGPMPYPRQADDVYHITKINDSNFVSMATRQWGLAVTDVMQSTVFGVCTEESKKHEALSTRFDYDTYFGTVLNRFIVQCIHGMPLTVYGTGHQRTGLMALEDAVTSLVDLGLDTPAPGTHRVINHVTETNYSINDIADSVQKVAVSRGIEAVINRQTFNPRSENVAEKPAYEIETSLKDRNFKGSSMQGVIEEVFSAALDYRHHIKEDLLTPNKDW